MLTYFRLAIAEDYKDIQFPNPPIDWGELGKIVVTKVRSTRRNRFKTAGWLIKDNVAIEVEMVWVYEENLLELHFTHGRAYDEETFWKYYHDAVAGNETFPFELKQIKPKKRATIMLRRYDAETCGLCHFLREYVLPERSPIFS